LETGSLQFSLIIPAAGSGSRMGEDIPKPYLEIAGKSILGHTLKCFSGIEGLDQIIIVTSADFLHKARKIVSEEVGKIPFEVLEGGRERQESVRNALQSVSGNSDLVAIHDAVRPFVKNETIVRCIRRAAEESLAGAIVAIPSRDTVKKVDDEDKILNTPERKSMWLAQTPQIFKKKILMDAYKKALSDNFQGTDDASIVERSGGEVAIVEGDIQNFKITYPMDLQLATIILSEK